MCVTVILKPYTCTYNVFGKISIYPTKNNEELKNRKEKKITSKNYLKQSPHIKPITDFSC